jgi:glycosyltransferase involved in cell wall biosynthesis
MLNREQVLALFKRARVYVSPSIHDGTPNSLLEAMACGCLPVVGNVDSLREWITPGENGLLVDATSTRELANGIVTALENQDLYEKGKNKNALIIAERADHRQCMAMTEAFYRNMIGSNS